MSVMNLKRVEYYLLLANVLKHSVKELTTFPSKSDVTLVFAMALSRLLF